MKARWTGLLLVLAVSTAPRSAYAGDPSLRWRTIQTEHFRIHFYQGEELAARALAVRAERAHRILAPLLGHVPTRPTHIVLSDEVDTANGSASVLPYNLIHLFASGPESESVLNDFDDWFNLLITHEYSHILHIDNVSGLPTLANVVLGLGLGKVYAPNQVQPRWFIEGLATYEESARTTAGRTRSRIFDMFLRAAVLEDEFQGLDKISSGALAFPHGSTAYLYGSYFLKFIADRYGDQALAQVSRRYGSVVVPFGINKAIAEAVGQNYEALWHEFYDGLRHRYEVQRAEIDARGRTPERVLTTHHENTRNPHAWPGPGNDIMYVRDDLYDRVALMKMPAQGGVPRVLYKMEVGGDAVPLPDGRHVVTSEAEVCRTNYFYQELFVVDVETGRRRQLTRCARAMSPDVSPDGRLIAFSANEEGGRGSSLAIVRTDGEGGIRFLVRHRDGRARVYTPTWSPDGKTIAYSEWQEGGFRDIVLYELESGRTRALSHDRAMDITPRYSPDGRYLLFASDRTGVYDVYAYELATGKLWQVTNVLGGAFEPALANDGQTLLYQGFSSLGYDIHATAFDPATFKEALPYVTDRDELPLTEVEAPPENVVVKEEPYSPWSTVHPWRIAAITTVPGGFEQLLTVDFSGGDATGIHSWTFHLEQGLGGRGETNEGLSYAWDRLWAPLSGNFFHRTVRAGGLVIDTVPQPYAEEQFDWSLVASLPVVRHIDHSATVNLNYHYNSFRAADRVRLPLDPNQGIAQVPEQGALSGFGAGFVFSNVRRYGFSVTAEEGRTLGFNLNLNHESLGGDFHTVEATWSWSEFLQMPLRRHVLMLNYGGGIATGNVSRRGLYFLGGFGDNASGAQLLLCALRVRADQCPAGTPSLRGYAPGAFYGDQFHDWTAEYRFPIAELERGASTLPVYATRLVGAAYADYGYAYFGRTDLGNFKLGVGAELGLNVVLGYAEGASLRLGYARGLMTGGQDQIYFQFQVGQLY